MASTLAFMSPIPRIRTHSESPSSPYATSPPVQMPNVFVVPPEEENSPAWCYFDAAQPPEHDLSTLPDLDVLETALNAFQHSDSFPPVFCRDSGEAHGSLDAVIMPRKDERRSISDVLMRDDGENKDLPRTVRGRESGNDSEIIEVIKVKRTDRQDPIDSAAPPPTKRSKTFRSRASKAFRSIKNVARGTRPNAEDIFASSLSTQATVTSSQAQRQTVDEPPLPPAPPLRFRNPTLSRRRSFIVSQIFHTPTLKSRASFNTSSPSEPAFPSSSTRSSPYTHVSHADTSPSLDRLAPAPDHDSLRTSSPSTQMFSRSRRRLSILNLQRLFSFSPDSDPSTTPTAVPTMSRDSSGPSMSSTSSGPDTPMDDPYPPEITASEEFGGAREGGWRSPRIDSLPAVAQGDISFEMRLDSLHFESISFDVDKF